MRSNDYVEASNSVSDDGAIRIALRNHKNVSSKEYVFTKIFAVQIWFC